MGGGREQASEDFLYTACERWGHAGLLASPFKVTFRIPIGCNRLLGLG
jgi:hypothetical protein